VFTQTQTKLDKEQRWQNVSGIFEVVKPNKLEGKHIILVDDFLTAGATLEALATTLLQVPNIKLSFLTLATAKNI
jgi:predicted amidophosphoribosyltransferase